MSLLDLPEDVLLKIWSYLSFDEVSHCRLVCRHINFISQQVLNAGFYQVEQYHAYCLKRVKSQLPRRESERRKHQLARHCDILTAVETRLSLLGMTFMKFMEMKLCCFIPGKVLDEIYKVLQYVNKEQAPVRAHEVLQELRDLSSMAMEHFDEKISPAFRKHKEAGPKIITGLNIFSPVTPHSSKTLNRHYVGGHKWKETTKLMAIKQTAHHKEIQALKQKVAEITKSNGELEKKVTELQTAVSAQMEKAKEHDLRIEYLSRLVENGSFPASSSQEIKTSITKLDAKIVEETGPVESERKRRHTRSTIVKETSRKRLKREK